MEVSSLFKGFGKHAKLLDIPIPQIRTNPNQPRKVFEQGAIEELAESIKQHGLLQPITVRASKLPKYELVAGERRLRACHLAGFKTISAIVIEATTCDSATLALIENIQRENLNYMEEALAYSSLINDFNLTQEELAARVGKNQATIANKLRLLKLNENVKNILSENNLTERHARALLRLDDNKKQIKALKIICEKGLNVQQTDELIEMMVNENAPPPPSASAKKHIRLFKDIRIFSNTIKQAIDMMQQSGVNAFSEKSETDDFIEYIVRIPKTG